jgi:hypothetical protein
MFRLLSSVTVRCIPAIVCALAATATAQAAPVQIGGGFLVDLPGKAVRAPVTLTINGQTVTGAQWRAGAWTVTTAEMPAPALTEDEAEVVYRKLVEERAQQECGDIHEHTNTRHRGMMGYYGYIHLGDRNAGPCPGEAKSMLRMDLFIVDGRFIDITYRGPLGSEDEDAVRAVFKSLRSTSAYTLKSPEGRFSVTLPFRPDRSESTIEIDGKEIDGLEWDGEGWGVEFARLPAATPTGPALKKFYDSLVEKTRGRCGRIIKQRDLTHRGLQGREVHVSTAHYSQRHGCQRRRHEVRSRLFVVGDRFFRLYYSPGKKQNERDAATMFASFQVER